MKLATLQKGILDWFWLTPHEPKSLTSIENVCDKLYRQFFPNRVSRNAKYEIFFPLLRYGVIEFSSGNSYRLSPSCFLYSNKYILSCNYSNQKVGEMSLNPMTILEIGLNIYQKQLDFLSAFGKENVPHSAYSLNNILKQIKPFRTILENWTDSAIIETKDYMYFSHHYSWVRPQDIFSVGVYKNGREVYSQRLVMINESVWKNVPNRAENIDAFNIACTWAHIENNWNLDVQYDPKQLKLTIKNIFFPIVIERQLFLNTLLEGAFDFNFLDREYYIKDREFLILNRLFSDKIQII